ncbi:MAG: SDR family oxidoreductase [Anaerolineales bacterium]|nr:SDR family oxidoreductase [Anaerolineales bacterium]
MGYFNGKTAIVTGGASGIGSALCESLAQRGAKVVAADIDAEGARRVAARIEEGGGKASAAEVDVSQEAAVENLVRETAAKNGRLDLMFNNAGATLCGEVRDLTLTDWRRMIDINLWGVIYGTAAAYRVMVAQGSGQIVNTASLDGLMPMPMAAPYTAAKHAVVGLSTTLRMEAADLGIKVSVACPGAVKTNILEGASFVGVKREGAIGEIGAFKMMEPGDCARAILRGVERNRAVILDGAVHNRLFWWLYRLNPDLYAALVKMGVSEIRKHRIQA